MLRMKVTPINVTNKGSTYRIKSCYRNSHIQSHTPACAVAYTMSSLSVAQYTALKNLYFQPVISGSYSSPAAFYRSAKQLLGNWVTLSKVKAFLADRSSYLLSAQSSKRTKHPQTIFESYRPNQTTFADTAVLRKTGGYILVYIDSFTRRMHTKYTKVLSADNWIRFLDQIFEKTRPSETLITGIVNTILYEITNISI